MTDKKACPHCGCTDADSAIEKAKKLHAASMHAAMVALSTPTNDAGDFEKFRAEFERMPDAKPSVKRKVNP